MLSETAWNKEKNDNLDYDKITNFVYQNTTRRVKQYVIESWKIFVIYIVDNSYKENIKNSHKSMKNV